MSTKSETKKIKRELEKSIERGERALLELKIFESLSELQSGEGKRYRNAEEAMHDISNSFVEVWKNET